MFVSLCIACQNHTEPVFSGKISAGENVSRYMLKLQGVDTSFIIKPDAEDHFSIVCSESTPFFMLEGKVWDRNKEQWNFVSPVYLQPGKSVTVNLMWKDGYMEIDTDDKVNRTIQAFRLYHGQIMKELWENPPLSGELENWVADYSRKAVGIVEKRRYNDEVRTFLTAWRQIEYINVMKGIRYLFPEDSTFRLPESLTGNLPDIPQVLDKPYWKLFPHSEKDILFYLQDCEEEPEGQLNVLKERFQTESIRQNISKQIIMQFLKRYPYSEANRQRLIGLCRDRTDEKEIIALYEKKAFISAGASLPDVTFEDLNGAKRSLSEFKGKYVYIDVWASWCVPCCAEVPYLQRLEKELNNKYVIFVSISVDKNLSQWKKKMQQLNMQGNQWIVTDSVFSELMNIRAIPHFLLYDKNSKLLEYHAPRPSSAVLKNKLQRLP